MNPTVIRSERENTPLFTAENRGGITVLRFYPYTELAGVDLDRINNLWDFFKDLRETPYRILLIIFPPGNLSPMILDRFRERIRHIPADEYVSCARDLRARVETSREDNALKRFIECVRSDRLFTIAAFEGEIDLNFLGLLLACDYRVASADTVIMNRTRELGIAPGTAVPWFLTRLAGWAKAADVITEREQLSANDAHDLGIVNRITSAGALESNALELAQHFAASSVPALLDMKRALAAAERDLSAYLDQRGAGFVRSLAEGQRHGEGTDYS